MAAVTLLEQAKAEKNPQAAATINMFAMEYMINALLPYVSMTGFDFPFTIFDTLPTVAPRDFNADFTSDYGKSSNFRVAWKNYGGKLEIDKALKKGNPDGASTQEMLQLSAIAKKWAQHLIEGAGNTELVGLNSFFTSFWSGQMVNAGTTDGGDVLTLAMMDDMLALVDNPTCIFMTERVNQRLTVLARTSTAHNIAFGIDQFGQQVLHYGNVPIYKMKDGDTGTDILSTTELGGSGSTATASSVYAIRFGEDGFHGFAPGGVGMEVKQVDPGTQYDVTRIEKNAGCVLKHKRAASKIRYVKNALT